MNLVFRCAGARIAPTRTQRAGRFDRRDGRPAATCGDRHVLLARGGLRASGRRQALASAGVPGDFGAELLDDGSGARLRHDVPLPREQVDGKTDGIARPVRLSGQAQDFAEVEERKAVSVGTWAAVMMRTASAASPSASAKRWFCACSFARTLRQRTCVVTSSSAATASVTSVK